MSESETSSTPQSRGLDINALKLHVLAHKIDVALWAIRSLTILFTLGYVFPIFGSAQNAYYKALLSNAATSALRLHQRLGRVQFTSQFFRDLVREDSCHYLFYSLIFIYVAPITLVSFLYSFLTSTSVVLLPIVLFAILHASSYSLTLLDSLGQNSWWGARLLISLVEFQSRNILRLTAFTEIMLMPLTIILILMGRAGLLTPFIYYHFLMQRYSSRRNPYTRNMFRELRVLLETTAANRKVPGFIKMLLLSIVNICCKLSPPQTTAQ